MGLQLATAFVAVKVDRPQLASEIQFARRSIIRGLSGIRINIGINPASITAARRQLTGLGFSGGSGGSSGGIRVPASPAWFRPRWNGGISPEMREQRRMGRFPSSLRPIDFLQGSGGGRGGGRGGPPSRMGLGGQLMRGNVGGFLMGSAQIATGIIGAQAALAALRWPVEATKDAVEFERTMVRVKSISEATDAEFAKMNESALKIGRTTKFSPMDAAKAQGIMAQQGMSADEIIKNTPLVLNFASAGNVKPEEAANTLLRISNSMKIPAQQLEEVANILARAEFKSLATVHSLGDAFKYVGPLGELAGQSITEVAAALSLLEDVGLGGSIGGTGYKRLVGTLANTTKVGKLGEMAGGNFDFKNAATGKLKPLADIVDEINAALGPAADGADKLNMAMKIFGERAGPQFVALLEKGGAAIRERETALGDKNIDIFKLAAKDLATAGGGWDQLMSTIQAFNISVMTPFLPVLGQVTQAFRQLLIAAMDSEQFKEMVQSVASFTGSLIELLFALNEAHAQLFPASIEEVMRGFARTAEILKLAADNVTLFTLALSDLIAQLRDVMRGMAGLPPVGRPVMRNGFGAAFNRGFGPVGDAGGVGIGQMARKNGFGAVGAAGWAAKTKEEKLALEAEQAAAAAEFGAMGDAVERDKIMNMMLGIIDPLLSLAKDEDEKKKDFKSQSFGVAEFHKQIQMSLLDSKKRADDKALLGANQEVAVNTREMKNDLKNLAVGRFA